MTTSLSGAHAPLSRDGQVDPARTQAVPSAQAVVFQATVEGFARSFKARLRPVLRQQLRDGGVDLEHLQATYPLELWDQLIRRTGAALFPTLLPEQQWTRIGREFIHGYSLTMVGRAALAMARLIGPKRMLARLERNFQSGCNFLAATTMDLGERLVEISTEMRPEFLPAWRNRQSIMFEFRLGMLEGILDVLGVRTRQVTVLLRDLESQIARYRVQWEP